MTHLVVVHTDKTTGQHAAACSCGWTGQVFHRLAREAARRSARFHRTYATTRDAVRETKETAA